MIGRSGNPTLKENTFEQTGHYSGENVMTIEGTVNKSFITLALLLGGAFVTWSMYFNGEDVFPYAIGAAIAGFILALIVSFIPRTAPYLVPLYAVLEGVFLGALSATYESLYNGITLQAALLTMGVFIALLLAYKARIIKGDGKFQTRSVCCYRGYRTCVPVEFCSGVVRCYCSLSAR